jgi:hypothetical protein
MSCNFTCTRDSKGYKCQIPSGSTCKDTPGHEDTAEAYRGSAEGFRDGVGLPPWIWLVAVIALALLVWILLRMHAK